MRLRTYFGFLCINALGICLLFSDCPSLERNSVLGDALNHPLTIAELIEIALANTPSTKKAYWNAERAAADVGIAESAYYPQIRGKGSAEHEVGHPSKEAVTTESADLCLDMLLYDCGKTNASVAATKQLLKAASWNVDWNVQQVLVSVFEATYTMLYAREVYDATLVTLQEAEKMVSRARELNRVGLKPVSDVYTAEATLFSAKMELTDKKELLKESESSLATVLGLPATTHLTLAPICLDTAPTKEDVDLLITSAYSHRADLQEKQAMYTAALDTVEKENAAAWPEFSCFGRGGVDTTHTNHRAQVNSQSVHSRAHFRQYSVGLKVEIPLFTGFDLTNKKKAALAEANLTKAEIDALQLEIARDVACAAYSLEAAQEKLPDAACNLESAKKAYEGTLERYSAGKDEIAALYNAQQQVAAARIQYNTVKTQWLTGIANLAYATGTL